MLSLKTKLIPTLFDLHEYQRLQKEPSNHVLIWANIRLLWFMIGSALALKYVFKKEPPLAIFPLLCEAKITFWAKPFLFCLYLFIWFSVKLKVHWF